MRVAVHLFDGAEELDWAGPYEIFGVWRMLTEEDDAAVDPVQLVTVTRDPGPVTCAKGLRVLADHTWDDLGPVDVLVYPGGVGTRAHLGDGTVHAWLHDLRDAGTLLVSVCTGSLVYADAGLLDGRPATTHWGSLDRLGTLGQDVEVRPDDRFVDDGDVVTAAGVSAGIDVALHLVARLDSVERARAVRRYAQYDPAPPV
jgi:transcriptional regulator GlxA family with amidase domain